MADHSEKMEFAGPVGQMSLLEKVLFFTFMLPIVIMHAMVSALCKKVMGAAWLTGEPKLERVARSIYAAHGCMTWFPSFPLSMTIVKLHRDGEETNELLLHGCVLYNENLALQLEALGEIRFIYVPSFNHDSFAMSWAEKYPDATVICHSEAYDEIAKGVTLSGTEDHVSAYDVVFHSIAPYTWTVMGEQVVEVPTGEQAEAGGDARALLFCDVVQNNHLTSSLFTLLPLGWTGLRVARFFKLMLVRDRRGLERFLLGLFRSVPGFECALFAHGLPMKGIDTARVIAEAVSRHLDDTIRY